MTKQDTRKHILKIRNSLSKYEVVSAGEDIISDIDEMIIKNGSMLLLAYMPLGNEIDLTPLFKRILSGYYKEKYDIDIVLGLPRICKKEMKFFRVKSLYDLYNLKKSSFGILEPDENCEEITAYNAYVLVPLIGLNKDKKRLGFGGGYYDRYFNMHKDNILCGVSYKFQTDLDFKGDDYDISMDRVFISRHC